MLGCLLSFVLVSSMNVEVPDPYLGWGFNFFKERPAEGTDFRRKFLAIGLPFRIKDSEDRDINAPTWIITPEIGYNTDIIQVNASTGYEFAFPTGYRATLSAIVLNLGGGIHYSLFNRTGYMNENGSAMNSQDRTSIAALGNFSFGPRWEFSEKYATRLMLDSRVLLGRIAFHTFRSERLKYLGLVMSLNFQFEFL